MRQDGALNARFVLGALEGYSPDEGMVLQVGVKYGSDQRWTDKLIGACKHGDGYLLLIKTIHGDPWQFQRRATAADIAIFVACKLLDDDQYRNTSLGSVRLWKEPAKGVRWVP